MDLKHFPHITVGAWVGLALFNLGSGDSSGISFSTFSVGIGLGIFSYLTGDLTASFGGLDLIGSGLISDLIPESLPKTSDLSG